MSECMDCPVEYFDQDFDCKPLGVRKLTPDERIQNSRSCNLCRAPIGPDGDFGYFDFSETDDDDEPEWVPLCFGCYRPIAYAESDVVDPRTGERATDRIKRLIQEEEGMAA